MTFDFTLNVDTPPEPRCDFCSMTPVYAAYDAPDFKCNPFSTDQLTQMSVGQWAACDICAKLVDKRDWEMLSRRAATMFVMFHPETPINYEELAGELLTLYNTLGTLIRKPI